MRIFGEASQHVENEIMEKHADILERQLNIESGNPKQTLRRLGDDVELEDEHIDELSTSVLLDSSVGNYDPENLRKIAHLLPNSKLIFIMRNPVEREFSKYRYHFQISSKQKYKRKFQNPQSFHNYVVQRLNRTDTPWRTSRYHTYVETALSLFKRENLLSQHPLKHSS